jgi:hypothetical protein
MMQTCGAGSNWGSAGSSTGQVCILGKHASLVAACKRFIRPQVTCKLRKSTGGPCTCDVPWWSVYMGLPLHRQHIHGMQQLLYWRIRISVRYTDPVTDGPGGLACLEIWPQGQAGAQWGRSPVGQEPSGVLPRGSNCSQKQDAKPSKDCGQFSKGCL